MSNTKTVQGYKIEKGIPRKPASMHLSIFDEMEVNDSIYFSEYLKARSFSSSIRTNYGAGYCSHEVYKKGYRVWRIQ